MNRNLLIGVLVVVLAVAAWAIFANQNQGDNVTVTPNPSLTPPPPPPPPTPTPSPTPTPTPSGTTTQQVVITDQGATPATITVKKGTTVTFVNNGTKLHWPASDPHPTHTNFSAFDPKQGIAVGGNWSFTFNETGTYRWHDHLQTSIKGTITVTE